MLHRVCGPITFLDVLETSVLTFPTRCSMLISVCDRSIGDPRWYEGRQRLVSCAHMITIVSPVRSSACSRLGTQMHAPRQPLRSLNVALRYAQSSHLRKSGQRGRPRLTICALSYWRKDVAFGLHVKAVYALTPVRSLSAGRRSLSSTITGKHWLQA